MLVHKPHFLCHKDESWDPHPVQRSILLTQRYCKFVECRFTYLFTYLFIICEIVQPSLDEHVQIEHNLQTEHTWRK